MPTPDTTLDSDLDVHLDVQDIGLDSVQAGSLSAVEAARVAGVHGRTIRRAITEGQLVATMEGGAYRVSPAALAAWRATRTPKPTPETGMDTTLDTRVDVQARVQDTVHQPAPGMADVIAAKDALVERLADEVAYLRVQLDQRGRQVRIRGGRLAPPPLWIPGSENGQATGRMLLACLFS